MTKFIYGVGIDDLEYAKSKKVKGEKVFECYFYKKWQNMISRCYGSSYKASHPSYDKASVCDDWLYFSNFKAWMQSKCWQGMELDKDLISSSGVYSPETCCFISKKLNAFMVVRAPSKQGLPAGVGLDKRDGSYSAYCNNPFTNKKERLGTFKNKEDAHEAWRKRKLSLAIELGNQEKDPRVLPALIMKYA